MQRPPVDLPLINHIVRLAPLLAGLLAVSDAAPRADAGDSSCCGPPFQHPHPRDQNSAIVNAIEFVKAFSRHPQNLTVNALKWHRRPVHGGLHASGRAVRSLWQVPQRRLHPKRPRLQL